VRKTNISAVIARRRFDNPSHGNILEISDRADAIVRALAQNPGNPGTKAPSLVNRETQQ
jgi:hypothetical protein